MKDIEIQKLITEKAKECRFGKNNFSKAASEIKEKYPELDLTINALRKRIRRKTLKMNKTNSTPLGKGENTTVEEDLHKGVLNCHYIGLQRITSEQEAVVFFKVNLEKWEPCKIVTNSWEVTAKDANGNIVTTTNYQVKLDLRLRDTKRTEKAVKDYFDTLIKDFNVRKNNVKTIEKGTTQVACFADLHFGAKTDRSKGILNTVEVSPEIITHRLAKAAKMLNECDGPVTVCLLGDLIESFTGLNHMNTWAELESWGAPAVIGTAKLLEDFFKSIKNFDKAYVISGNHDRITIKAEHDQWGQGAAIISHILEKSGFDIKYHPLIQQFRADDISYINIHGDKLKNTKPEKIFFEYGQQGYYNVLTSAHTHNRSLKRSFPIIEISDMHPIDSRDYRAVTVAPIFTGNFWAESKSWTSSAGFSRFRANAERNNVYHEDIPL